MSLATVPNKRETYLGHVRRGVIVLDTPTQLSEGTPVRIEILTQGKPTLTSAEKAEQFRLLMEKWNEEDAHITDEEVIAFIEELEKDRGLGFRDDQGLESILLDK